VTDAWLLRLPDGGRARSPGCAPSLRSRRIESLEGEPCDEGAAPVAAARSRDRDRRGRAGPRDDRSERRSAAAGLVLLRLPPPTSAPTATTPAATPTPAAGRRDAADRSALAAPRPGPATAWPMPVVGLDCYVMAIPDARRADEWR
jgi:hypothetical protein